MQLGQQVWHQALLQFKTLSTGNKIRYHITQDGPALHIYSTPYHFNYSQDDDDEAISDCIIALRMDGVVYEVVPFDHLISTVSASTSNQQLSSTIFISVPLTFAPQSKCSRSFFDQRLNTTMKENRVHLDRLGRGYEISYWAEAYKYEKDCPIGPTEDVFGPGDTDCIQTAQGNPAWKSVRIDNTVGCATL